MSERRSRGRPSARGLPLVGEFLSHACFFDGQPEEGQRCKALWVAIVARACSDAEGSNVLGGSGGMESRQARLWLSQPERWPWPVQLAMQGAVPDPETWRATVLPRLRERWREADAKAAARARSSSVATVAAKPALDRAPQRAVDVAIEGAFGG